MTIGIRQVGVWAPSRLLSTDDALEAAAELDELGFATIWMGNGTGMLRRAAELLAATGNITVATGILNIRRNPVSASTAAASHAEIGMRHPGRFLLGLGNGWAPTADRGTGGSAYEEIVGYLDALDSAPAPVPAGDRMLAALGPRMLALAAERSAGAHPFLTTPEHTRWARELLGEGPRLVPEQMVVLETDPAKARSIARGELDFYLTKSNYLYSLRRFGFTEEDFADGGSDRLVDSLVAWGDVDTVLKRIDEHRQAGADQVAVQPISEHTALSAPRQRLPREQYRRLAEALRSAEHGAARSR